MSNNNILNYWLSLCSKCPPFALTHAWRCVRHCLTAVSITRWSSLSQAVRIHEAVRCRPWSALQWHFMQHYLMLSRGNFYAENSILTKFCYLALGGSGNYALSCSCRHVRNLGYNLWMVPGMVGNYCLLLMSLVGIIYDVQYLVCCVNSLLSYFNYYYVYYYYVYYCCYYYYC